LPNVGADAEPTTMVTSIVNGVYRFVGIGTTPTTSTRNSTETITSTLRGGNATENC